MNEVTQRIDKLRSDRGWTVYKLSMESGVAQQTIHNWFSSKTYPLIPALMEICEAFGITMGDFFADGNLVEMTPELRELHEDWSRLSPADRASVKSIIKSLVKKD